MSSKSCMFNLSADNLWVHLDIAANTRQKDGRGRTATFATDAVQLLQLQ